MVKSAGPMSKHRAVTSPNGCVLSVLEDKATKTLKGSCGRTAYQPSAKRQCAQTSENVGVPAQQPSCSWDRCVPVHVNSVQSIRVIPKAGSISKNHKIPRSPWL